MVVMICLFWFLAFMIFFAMIGYPLSLLLLNKIVRHKQVIISKEYMPSVTLMIVAHNEEKVILEKLNNVLSLDYPRDKWHVLIASDNSTDQTNAIVERFIADHRLDHYMLYKVKERKGKTNAQNEAQKLVKSDILVMTDANSMLKADCIKEIVKNFNDPEVAYVTGKLEYCNSDVSSTSESENTYWNIDLTMRKIESDIQTVTAGNGALYAVRNRQYFDIPLIHCHDSYFPQYYSTHGYRSIFDEKAVVYEKAGENDADEYKRKVRMNRTIVEDTFQHWDYLNVFKYKWFSFFYFGHRKCRYLLWLNHSLLLAFNVYLAFKMPLFLYVLLLHIGIYLLGLIGIVFHKFRICKFIGYYFITVFSQMHGVYNNMTGKAKPFWEKAESTR